MDWSKLPDIVAVALLTLAFFSVARFGRTLSAGVWLVGWLMIVLHFGAFMFLPAPGIAGIACGTIGTAALAWAGVLFMWASVPYRSRTSSRWMLAALITANTLYIAVLSLAPAGHWLFKPAALLMGVLPLAVFLGSSRTFRHPLRILVVVLYLSLAVFLLLVQNRAGNGTDLAINAVLFTVYFGCCLHFWYAYRRATTGALITVFGFLAWSSVFVVGPAMQTFFPQIHVEGEVWNLPKYVVAVGMILILLEDQIEHNRFLALHDELTGLPNRRLFQDRLANALERARRTSSHAALLLIDLDQFKGVNDTMGHHVGDELLKHVSRLFVGRVRRIDTVARTGGDEFSVILEEPVSRNDAAHVAQDLTDLLGRPIELEGRHVQIGASAGIAIFPEDAGDPEALCIAADLRMYASKREARSLEEGNERSSLQADPFPPPKTAAGLPAPE
ncbi:MAG: GGDEF domain-containing protein [Terracidiphilus sp.]